MLSKLIALALSLWGAAPELTITSLESKTTSGGEVINKISFEVQGKRDIWRMRQSHGGPHLASSEWDELAIIVEDGEVSYQQLKEGRPVEYRASCFFCHANGPRLIRPKVSSGHVVLALYNMRIKTYGTLRLKEKKLVGKRPLLARDELSQDPLKVKTCLLCHNGSAWGRAPLQRQHAETIKHLSDQNQMPPWPFTLSAEEKAELEQFLQGD